MHVFMHACGDQKLVFDIFVDHSLLLRQVFFLNLEFAGLA